MKVEFAQSALDDLQTIFIYVAEASDVERAEGYDHRIRMTCASLSDFPRRGTPRGGLGEGVRTIPFERQATIVYRIADRAVHILRVLHRGRDLNAATND